MQRFLMNLCQISEYFVHKFGNFGGYFRYSNYNFKCSEHSLHRRDNELERKNVNFGKKEKWYDLENPWKPRQQQK